MGKGGAATGPTSTSLDFARACSGRAVRTAKPTAAENCWKRNRTTFLKGADESGNCVPGAREDVVSLCYGGKGCGGIGTAGLRHASLSRVEGGEMQQNSG
jgi:hypothetical protein